jgi:spore maturation protein CgeB
MRVVMFYHSLVSDWNHGNAHFLRGVVSELMARGHDVSVLEQARGWSRTNLVREHGPRAIQEFCEAYPHLRSREYDPAADRNGSKLSQELEGADLVLVHEWNAYELVERVGRHRATYGRYRLLFHDTHHRSVTDRRSMDELRLEHYDGVLAFGEPVREVYERSGWARRAWTWHEAADTRLFRPIACEPKHGDLVWIGNWGDNERAAELGEFLFNPVRRLRLSARVHGVRYPTEAMEAITAAGIEYGGWLPNFRVPETFARYRVTMHIPRGPYVRALPGIPTIRPFEAMACGIPLVSAPWDDTDGLFRAGKDYLIARDGDEMSAHLRALLEDPSMAADVSASGRQRILDRHTCVHRVDELMRICDAIAPLQEEPVATVSGKV